MVRDWGLGNGTPQIGEWCRIGDWGMVPRDWGIVRDWGLGDGAPQIGEWCPEIGEWCPEIEEWDMGLRNGIWDRGMGYGIEEWDMGLRNGIWD